jgi:8-amino-7-oxononanoate synthase
MNSDWIDAELRAIAAAGLARSLRTMGGPQGPMIELDGRTVVNFCGNDYLGLAGDRRLMRAAQAAAGRWGAGAGSSRLIAGNLGIFAELEADLARLTGAEAALLFPSGYHANLGAIAALAGPGDTIFSDRLNHASIIDGCRLSRAEVRIYEHGDVGHLGQLLATAPGAGRKLVVTETVFSMDGDLAPLAELSALARRSGAMVLVDEAHALGVLGPSGRGGLEHCGLGAGDVDAVMGTLGKALGSAGAFVAGSGRLREWLINRARTFIFTTGPAPAAAGAAREGVRVAGEEPWRRERVLRHAERVRAAFAVMGLDCGRSAAAIVPALIGDASAAMRASEALLDRGIFVQGIRPPTVPAGTSRLRINLSAGHTDEQIDQLIGALTEVMG